LTGKTFGRRQTVSSSLAAEAGQRFESARRLSIFALICRKNTERRKGPDETAGPILHLPYSAVAIFHHVAGHAALTVLKLVNYVDVGGHAFLLFWLYLFER
jgi:hypothetical protein